MKRKLSSLIVILLMFLSIEINAKNMDRSYRYKSITKDEVVTYFDKIETKENEIINTWATANKDFVLKTVLTTEFVTKVWEKTDQKEDTEITAQRSGDIIKIQGKLKGKEISREYKIGNRPWFQAWNLSLGFFVLSGETRQEFWTVRNDLKEFVLVVLREQEETIIINGKAVEAVKVKVTVNNWMSKFWSVYYWFGKSDGVYLKYKGANGPPGTPVTDIELINEEN